MQRVPISIIRESSSNRILLKIPVFGQGIIDLYLTMEQLTEIEDKIENFLLSEAVKDNRVWRIWLTK